jgi:methylisocitrate lyase
VDVDIDTGYGNALNAYWTTKNFAMIGAAGVRIEDQVWPKRCGHMAGKQVISKVEMVGKIEAAIKARDEEGTGMVIGARTDARTVTDLEDTIERAKAYAEAGADYVYVEAPQSLEEVERLVNEIPTPVAFNIIPGGKTPPFLVKELKVKGVSYLSVPMICLYTATKAIMEALETLKETRDVVGLAEKGVSWAEFNEIVGVNRWRRLELEACPAEELIERYGTDDLERIVEEELAGTEEVWKNRGRGS